MSRPDPLLTLKERDVTKQVVDWMEWNGWRALRNQVSANQNQAGGWFRTGEKGMPDWLFLYYFKHQPMIGVCVQLWIEMKKEGEDLKPDQVDWHMKEVARGALVWTVDKFEPFVEKYESVFGWMQKHREGQQLLI